MSETASNNTSNEPSAAPENQPSGVESVLESFAIESGSDDYMYSQQHSSESVTMGPQAQENSNIGPLVALVREQYAEIENLKMSLVDLTAANAGLQTKIHKKDTIRKLSKKNAELKQKLLDLDRIQSQLNVMKLNQNILSKKLRLKATGIFYWLLFSSRKIHSIEGGFFSSSIERISNNEFIISPEMSLYGTAARVHLVGLLCDL